MFIQLAQSQTRVAHPDSGMLGETLVMFESPFVSAEQQRGDDYWCTNKTFNEYRYPHTDGRSLAQLTHTHGFLCTLWSCGNKKKQISFAGYEYLSPRLTNCIIIIGFLSSDRGIILLCGYETDQQHSSRFL